MGAIGLVLIALGVAVLGCYFVFLVVGELRPSDTVLGMRQRYARQDRDTKILFWFLAIVMFFTALMCFYLAFSW